VSTGNGLKEIMGEGRAFRVMSSFGVSIQPGFLRMTKELAAPSARND